MKKDKQWFVDKWTKERNKTDVYDPTYHFINEFISDVNQLDEPEVLSQEWIDEHSNGASRSQYVWVEDLQNLLVPKRELPVIPKFVAEWIEEDHVYNVYGALSAIDWERHSQVHDWVFVKGGINDFARAWLDGFTIDNGEEEQKYYVINNKDELILARSNDDVVGIRIRHYDDLKTGLVNYYQLTEQEIKDYDERYWPFAVKVEELEE